MKKIQDWEAMLSNDTIDFMCSLPARRRSGRTTRMADHYIQKLFTAGSCKSIDHSLSREASIYLAKVIMDRLSMEHGCAIFLPGTEKSKKDYQLSRCKCFDYDGYWGFTALN